MIIKLENGNKIVLDDVVKDPRAEGVEWLRAYNERRKSMELNEMTPDQLYNRLNWLAEHRREHGRGNNEGAAYVRDYCKKERKRVKDELKRRNLPTTRPGDGRVYGPGAAVWQRAGGAL